MRSLRMATWTSGDPVSASWKADYANCRGLRGMMLWELSGDDPTGSESPFGGASSQPADATGLLGVRTLFVTRDGKHYTYETRRVLSQPAGESDLTYRELQTIQLLRELGLSNRKRAAQLWVWRRRGLWRASAFRREDNVI